MNTIAIEKENQVKSGVSTILITMIAAMILWLYKLKIEIPGPFTEASGVEMMINTSSGSPGEKGSAEASFIPIETNRKTIEETTDKEAIRQEKTPEKITEKPVDHTIDNMVQNRVKAKQNTGTEEKQGKEKGKNKGNAISETGNTPGLRDNKSLNIHTTFTGRSFTGGSTSMDCHEEGKVVLDIQLLPSGKIILMDVDPATNGSDCLINAAKEMLTHSSFNESTKQLSKGSVTFIFKLN